jgi:hypothetical protein
MNKATTIDIITNPRFSLARFLRVFGFVFGGIAVGIWTGSAAMQWAGFILGLIFSVALAASEIKRDKSLTIADARKRLDEIEDEEAAE